MAVCISAGYIFYSLQEFESKKMDAPSHKDSSTIKGEVKSQRRRVTSKEVPENTALEDDKSATNEVDAGQMDSSHNKEEAVNQLTPNPHWAKEFLKTGEVLKEDIQK